MLSSFEQFLKDKLRDFGLAPEEYRVSEGPLHEHSLIAEVKPNRNRREKLSKVAAWLGELGFSEESSKENNLGVFLRRKGWKLKLMASYYSGCTWIRTGEGRFYLNILPKGEERSLYSMLTSIWNNEYTRLELLKNFNEYFHLFPEEELVPLESVYTGIFTLITLFSYVYTIEFLVKKGLKKEMITCINDMKRPKGKILLKETFQKFHSKGYLDRVISAYVTLTEDSLVNRLLKYSLYWILDYSSGLAKFDKGSSSYDLLGELRDRARYLLKYFSSVSFTDSFEDSNFDFLFKKSFSSLFFPEYRLALDLLRTLLRLRGVVPPVHAGSPKSRMFVVPYVVNMPSLYELFVLSRFLQIFEGSSYILQKEMRPSDRVDILIKRKNGKDMIVEVKYIYTEAINDEELKKEKLKEHISQVGRYAFNRYFKSPSDVDIVLVYPSIDSGTREFFKNYNVVLCECPPDNENKPTFIPPLSK